MISGDAADEAAGWSCSPCHVNGPPFVVDQSGSARGSRSLCYTDVSRRHGRAATRETRRKPRSRKRDVSQAPGLQCLDHCPSQRTQCKPERIAGKFGGSLSTTLWMQSQLQCLLVDELVRTQQAQSQVTLLPPTTCAKKERAAVGAFDVMLCCKKLPSATGSSGRTVVPRLAT